MRTINHITSKPKKEATFPDLPRFWQQICTVSHGQSLRARCKCCFPRDETSTVPYMRTFEPVRRSHYPCTVIESRVAAPRAPLRVASTGRQEKEGKASKSARPIRGGSKQVNPYSKHMSHDVAVPCLSQSTALRHDTCTFLSCCSFDIVRGRDP
ncbi:hypothetical protein BD289DRAFT_79754 [Coniella lustricola]|uniref:Uncharacterized protein n=1 Tax=Coniella lustricola TaxID=2025994 RepID=A0A2T2ZZ54_9PEZI|nr:hypothetical protein BD289DRAFT_79754 [Coniella lustricola]